LNIAKHVMNVETIKEMFDTNTWRVLAVSTAGMLPGLMKGLHGIENVAISIIPILTVLYLGFKLFFLIKNKGKK